MCIFLLQLGKKPGQMKNTILNLATVNQHPQVWMVSGQETIFCWVPAPSLLVNHGS
jgi:hypothetical protein